MNVVGLYSNSNSRRDFVQNAMSELADPGCNVYVAVAFFTEPDIIREFLDRGCKVRLVVRLGFPTNAHALEQLLRSQGVEIRYFTDESFHPKLFIFGTQAALVGSANLTRSAMLTNQEVMVTIENTDARFPDIASLFNEYWNEAKVLDDEALKTYRDLCAKYADLWKNRQKLTEDVQTKIGKVSGRNITRDHTKPTNQNLFIEDFRKAYQECISAFNTIRRLYEQYGKRKIAESRIPLRLEIDSFISFIRETHAEGEKWLNAPLLSGKGQEDNISALIAEWHQTSWPYFEEEIVEEKYPRILSIFSSPASITNASDDDLFDALCVVHSFGDRFRFFLGGVPSWKKAFLSANDGKKTRSSLAYLLYGTGKVEELMANLIYNSEYKLNEFGQANVQELIGWINKDELPIINGRTTKVLRYLGFDIRQL